MSLSSNIRLTVGITAHAEGLLAHKTMKSVFAALENLDSQKYPYEIIVHIDNGDEATNNYFKRYENDKRFKIIHSAFKDLGMSRNCIVQHATGQYISFLDADDMLSSNWYVNALKRMEESKEPIMVHPNIQFNFGAGTRLEFTWRKDSYEKIEDAILLAGVNRWCSAIMGQKETFLKYPYMKTEKGFGYEDYNLNSETVSHGVKHMIAPETVMFYRQKAEGSLLASSNTEHAIQPYTSLLDIDFMQSISQETIAKMRPRTAISRRRTKLYSVYKKIRSHEGVNYFITPVAKMTKKLLRIQDVDKKPHATIPQFMLEEWKKINAIESQLYPSKEALEEIFEAEADDYNVGLAYYDLVKQIPSIPDYVFIVPWIRTGGADKVLVNYLKAIEKHHPEWKVAIITTVPGKNSYADALPANAYVVDFGNRADIIWPPQKELLFSRLITQLRCNNLHIINSEYGYRWAATHKKFIASNCKLDVSIFSITNKYAPEIGNYANPYLLDIYPIIHKIYTDNQNVIDEMCEREAFDPSKMQTIYQPITQYAIAEMTASTKNNTTKDAKFRILWASRIDREKLPEIIRAISNKLDPNKYQIDIYGEFAKGYAKDDITGLAARYKGSFSGIASIKTEQYDMFLYTSDRDGLPNVILEAAGSHLPIVASNIGGIGELIIDHKTGLLIDDIKNPNAYIQAIQAIEGDENLRSELLRNAEKLLIEQHSWNNFLDESSTIFNTQRKGK